MRHAAILLPISAVKWNSSPGSKSRQAIAACVSTWKQIEAEEILAEWANADLSPGDKALITNLQAILRGDRDPALADDSALSFERAVELRMLLEALGA